MKSHLRVLIRTIKKDTQGVSIIVIVSIYIIIHTAKTLGFLKIPDVDISLVVISVLLILTTIVLQISLKMEDRKEHGRFKNLYDAAPIISERIVKEFQKNKDREIILYIVGGRLRKITDIIETIKNGIEGLNITNKKTSIIIYCLDPEYVGKGMCFGHNSGEHYSRNRNYKDIIRKGTAQIQLIGSSNQFAFNSIKIEIKYYRCPPFCYGFYVENSFLFWGLTTWNIKNIDFDGPVNPCCHVEYTDELFEDHSKWFKSVIDFLDYSASIPVGHHCRLIQDQTKLLNYKGCKGKCKQQE